MTRIEAARVLAAASVAEMALNRRDPIADVLLSQAARAAAGLSVGVALQTAADIARDIDMSDSDEAAFAARKLTQALCRLAIQESQATLLK